MSSKQDDGFIEEWLDYVQPNKPTKSYRKLRAKAAIEAHVTSKCIEVLGNVQLDYGNQRAQIWVEGKLIGLLEYLDQLEAELEAGK